MVSGPCGVPGPQATACRRSRPCVPPTGACAPRWRRPEGHHCHPRCLFLLLNSVSMEPHGAICHTIVCLLSSCRLVFLGLHTVH